MGPNPAQIVTAKDPCCVLPFPWAIVTVAVVGLGPLTFARAGVTVHVKPSGTEHVKGTEPVKPAIGDTVAVNTAEWPAEMVWEDGEAVRLKSVLLPHTCFH